MPFKSTVRLEDPQNIVADKGLLLDNLQAALKLWGRYVTGSGSVDVLLRVGTPGGTAEIDTTWLSSRIMGSATVTDNHGTHRVTVHRAGAAHELRSGQDLNGSQADFSITLSPEYLARLWLDPSPLSLADGPPPHLLDAVSVFAREIGRGLGIDGYYKGEENLFDRHHRSEFETLIVEEDGAYFFSLPDGAAETLYDDPVPLSFFDDAYHRAHRLFSYGNRGDGADLLAGLFTGTGLVAGERYAIGTLDLAILEDLGLTVTPSAAMPLVNRIDDAEDVIFRTADGAVIAADLSGAATRTRALGTYATDTVIAFGNFDFDAVAAPFSPVDVLIRRADASLAWLDVSSEGITVRALPSLGRAQPLAFTGNVTGTSADDLLLLDPVTRSLDLYDVYTAARRPLFDLNATTSVAGIGDFNGTGPEEILFRDTASKSLYHWNGTGFTSVMALEPEWTVRTGDFLGTELDDLMLYNTATRAVLFYDFASEGFV